jgi:hypothetical protein
MQFSCCNCKPTDLKKQRTSRRFRLALAGFDLAAQDRILRLNFPDLASNQLLESDRVANLQEMQSSHV